MTKPRNTGSLEQTLCIIRQELIPKVKALCARQSSEARPALAPTRVTPAVTSTQGASRVDILAIGTSTGGPSALGELLPALSGDFPVPVVIVQHMPPLFTRLLAERLNKKSALAIHEGEPGQELQAGHAWIAPGDYHMVLERQGSAVRVGLNREPPENSCRPAVDALFRSVAAAFGANVLAVVLTGMGADGLRGSELIRQQGGQVLVQDEESSVVWGMPGQVAAAGYANGILPLHVMADEIDRRVQANRVAAGMRR